MLVSPIRVHKLLSGLLGATDAEGPHTALLITPQGQLLAQATAPDDDEDGEENGDAEGDDEDGADKDDEEEQDEGDDDDDDDDEPYLEGPERLRLLLGLASQWEEDESPRVECEVSDPEQAGANGSLDASSCAQFRCPSLKRYLQTLLLPCLLSSRHTPRHSCWF